MCLYNSEVIMSGLKKAYNTLGSVSQANKWYDRYGGYVMPVAQPFIDGITKFLGREPMATTAVQESLSTIKKSLEQSSITSIDLQQMASSVKSFQGILKDCTTLLGCIDENKLNNAAIANFIAGTKDRLKDIQKNDFTKLLFDASAVYLGILKLINLLDEVQKATSGKDESQSLPYLKMAGTIIGIVLPTLIYMLQSDANLGLRELNKNLGNASGIIKMLQQPLNLLKNINDSLDLSYFGTMVTGIAGSTKNTVSLIAKLNSLRQNPIAQQIPSTLMTALWQLLQITTTPDQAISRSDPTTQEQGGDEPLTPRSDLTDDDDLLTAKSDLTTQSDLTDDLITAKSDTDDLLTAQDEPPTPTNVLTEQDWDASLPSSPLAQQITLSYPERPTPNAPATADPPPPHTSSTYTLAIHLEKLKEANREAEEAGIKAKEAIRSSKESIEKAQEVHKRVQLLLKEIEAKQSKQYKELEQVLGSLDHTLKGGELHTTTRPAHPSSLYENPYLYTPPKQTSFPNVVTGSELHPQPMEPAANKRTTMVNSQPHLPSRSKDLETSFLSISPDLYVETTNTPKSRITVDPQPKLQSRLSNLGTQFSSRELELEFKLVEHIQNGDVEQLQKFLTEHPNLKNYQDSDGNYLLHLASKRGNLNMIQMLMKNMNLSPNVYNHEGKTPLHIIAATTDLPYDKIDEHLQIIKAFKAANADFNARINKEKYTPTPLHIAALTSTQHRTVEALLNCGADITLRYKDSTAKKPSAGLIVNLLKSNDTQTIDTLVSQKINKLREKVGAKILLVNLGRIEFLIKQKSKQKEAAPNKSKTPGK